MMTRPKLSDSGLFSEARLTSPELPELFHALDKFPFTEKLGLKPPPYRGTFILFFL